LLNKLKQKKVEKKSLSSKPETSLASKPKRKTEDGFKIYTEEELGLNIECKFTLYWKTLEKCKQDQKEYLVKNNPNLYLLILYT